MHVELSTQVVHVKASSHLYYPHFCDPYAIRGTFLEAKCHVENLGQYYNSIDWFSLSCDVQNYMNNFVMNKERKKRED